MSKSSFRFSLIGLFALLCTACETPFVNPPQHGYRFSYTEGAATAGGVAGIAGAAAVSGPVALAVPAGTVIGASMRGIQLSTARMLQILQADGVNVIQIGNRLCVIIPADKLFDPGKTDILQTGYPILEDVRQFLIRYGDVPLTVYAFGDGVYDNTLAKQLTMTQARKVSGYFWQKGRPFYHLQAIGMGNQDTVASNHNPTSSTYNRRIEIVMPVIPSQFHWLHQQVRQDLDLNDS